MIKKIAVETYMSITTLNVNGLKAPTKRCRYRDETCVYAAYR